MPLHAQHASNMVYELKQQYQNEVEYLRAKIREQETEIDKLNAMISILNNALNKEYDS